MKYRCKSDFMLYSCDTDGFIVEDSCIAIKSGEIFEKEKSGLYVLGNHKSIRLINNKRCIEIMPSTLKTHFKLVKEEKC